MNIKDILHIYKDKIIDNNDLIKDHITIVFNNEEIHINIEDLSIIEKDIIMHYSQTTNKKSEWYKFLELQDNNNTFEKGTYQLIHFLIDKTEAKAELLSSIESFFSNKVDSFFYNDSAGVIVLKGLHNEIIQSSTLDMIDLDYGSKTKIFVGIASNITNIQAIYNEEKSIFNNSKIEEKITNFSDTFIDYYVKSYIKDSPSIKYLSNIINSDNELISLIISMWKNQGNQSAVSKELYLHRNTISYRINKLNEENGLDLRNASVLLFSYILTK